jgi:hypothetical protein
MTPDQAIALLSVEEWPPKLEHWPPKNKSQWKPGMRLVGRIETAMTLPRPEGSKKRGEPYTALYVRREGDRRLVMFHGWHTAAEDLDGMHPAPGLLFACVYRGERDNGFEDFKYIVAPFDPPAAADNGQQARQETGQAQRPRSTQAPEGGEGEVPPSSGSNQRPTSIAGARAYVQVQPPAWQERFRQLLGDARAAGEVGDRPSLKEIQALIARTHAALASGEAA